MLILQLELKDLLFTNWIKDSNCEVVEFKSGKFLKRDGLDEFLITLAKHFRIAVWSRYEEDTQSEMIKYIENLGIYIVFQHTGLIGCYSDEIVRNEKRLKRLNCRGFNPSQIIALESEVPYFENYGNHFIIKAFQGENDTILKDVVEKLIAIKNVEDTRRIND